MPVWEDYSPDLFVDCDAILTEIDEWANKFLVEKRLWSLIAPPAAGKTWLLRAAQTKWMATPKRLVIWVDVPSLVNLNELTDKSKMLNNQAILKWLEGIQSQASTICADVNPIRRNLYEPTNSYMIRTLVQEICHGCDFNYPPIVLVDGYDQINEKQAEVVDEYILRNCLTQDCVRILIGRRDTDALKDQILRLHERQIRLDIENVLDKQFTAFIQKFYPWAVQYGSSILPFMKSKLPTYTWNHFFINAFLFDHLLSKRNVNPRDLFVAADLRNCCNMMIARPDEHNQPRYQPLAVLVFQHLKLMAEQLNDTWSSKELEDLLNLHLYDKSVEQLFAYGAVYAIGHTGSYKIVDGLRDLLRSF